MSTGPKQKLTEAEYLAIERAAPEKSEFLAGEMYAMAGATLAHTQIVSNLVRHLGVQLRGGPCRVVASDLRVKVAETGLQTYPDVVVFCGEPRLSDEHRDTLLNPRVLIEVLSSSTEAYDRGEKFAHYRRLPSLREYVLVSQTDAHIERFVRADDSAEWTLSEVAGLAATLPLDAIGCTLSLAEVYEQVEVAADPFPAPPRAGD